MEQAKYLPADERRAVTVEAVVALAAKQNPSEITTAAIAKQMRLTQGALFRHFPNKDAIWQAVMEWVAERLLSGMEQTAAASAKSALVTLESMFMAHVQFVSRHPGVPRMIFGELQRSEASPAKRVVHQLVRQYGERLRAVIEQGKQQGVVRKDTDAAAASTLFIGMIQGLVMQSMLAGDVRRIKTDAPGTFALYLRGIRSMP